MIRRLPTTFLLAGLLALTAASCSSDAKLSSPSTVGGGQSNIGQVPTGADADGTSAASDPDTSTGASTGSATPAGAGCTAEVTGDATVSWVAPDGPYAAQYGPWTVGGLDSAYFVLSCVESGLKNSISFSSKNIPIALGAQTFAIRDLTTGSTDPISTTIFVDGSAWGPTGDGGTLTITEFDQTHISGSFTVPITNLLTGGGSATLTGTFALTAKDGV